MRDLGQRAATRLLLVLALCASVVLGTLVVASPAQAVGTYDNAIIADDAIAVMNSAPYQGPVNGTCKTFVNNIVHQASGGTQWPVDPGGDYQQAFRSLGTEVSGAAATKGDIIQIGQWDGTVVGHPMSGHLHTAIILANNGNNSFTVIDSNWVAAYTVGTHTSFNPYAWAPNEVIKIWRLGSIAQQPPSAPPLPVITNNPIINGGFNNGQTGWWTSGSANVAIYAHGSVAGTDPYEGSGYLATNASAAGDSIYQTANRNVSPGDTYCVTARVVTVGNTSGAGGTLAIWFTGLNTAENSLVGYSNLPGGNAWQLIKTCATATVANSQIQVRLYPNPGSPSVGLDAIDFGQSLGANGGFNIGLQYWGFAGNTGYAAYSNEVPGVAPYEGTKYGALNTTTAGGGMYQDLPHDVGPGDTFCVDGVVTSDGTNGASGDVAIWLMGDPNTQNENSTYHFDGLVNGTWQHVRTCAMATVHHSTVRVQVYPTPGGPTIGVDAFSVQKSYALNGGYNDTSSAHWAGAGNVGYGSYTTYNGASPFEGGRFEVVQGTNDMDAGIYQDRAANMPAQSTVCLTAMMSGSPARLALWAFTTNPADPMDSSVADFAGSPVGTWVPVTTCLMFTTTRSSGVIRPQIYTNSGTVLVDALSLN